MKERVVIFIHFILVCLFFTIPEKAASVGSLAQEMALPAHFVAKLLRGICTATGIGLIIASIIKFKEYRRSQHVRFSLIFFLLLIGLALIGLGHLPLPDKH